MKNDYMRDEFSLHTAERFLDAPLLSFDLPNIVEKIKNQENWKMGERDAITLVKSDFMRIVLIALHEQSEINFHESGNMISLQLLEGKVNFQTKKQSVMLGKGSLLTFHEDMKHTLIAVEESVFLLIVAICPVIPEYDVNE